MHNEEMARSDRIFFAQRSLEFISGEVTEINEISSAREATYVTQQRQQQ